MAAGQKGAGQGGRSNATGNSATGNAAASSAGTRDTDALRAFAEELRAWRTERTWTQAELGAQVGYSESMIAQVEGCYKPPVMQMAEAFDRVFGTPGYAKAAPGQEGKPGTFMRLTARIRKLSFPVAFRPFTDAEEEATALYIFEHGLFPGLFQLEDYARTLVFEHPGVTEEQARDRLEARMSRQAILERDEPPRLWVLLHEPVLHRPVCSPETMYRQLTHVVGLSRRPNVTIQVLPDSIHVGLQGSFHMAEVHGATTATFIEDATDGRTTQNPATLNYLSERFRYLQTEAMAPKASRELMEKVAEESWKVAQQA